MMVLGDVSQIDSVVASHPCLLEMVGITAIPVILLLASYVGAWRPFRTPAFRLVRTPGRSLFASVSGAQKVVNPDNGGVLLERDDLRNVAIIGMLPCPVSVSPRHLTVHSIAVCVQPMSITERPHLLTP